MAEEEGMGTDWRARDMGGEEGEDEVLVVMVVATLDKWGEGHVTSALQLVTRGKEKEEEEVEEGGTPLPEMESFRTGTVLGYEGGGQQQEEHRGQVSGAEQS